jgi:hypothetical protein
MSGPRDGLLRAVAKLRRIADPLVPPQRDGPGCRGRAERRPRLAPLPHVEADRVLGEYRLADAGAPSAAVAYRREAIEAAHAECGIDIDAVWLGRWGGRPGGVTAHDVIVSTVSR